MAVRFCQWRRRFPSSFRVAFVSFVGKELERDLIQQGGKGKFLIAGDYLPSQIAMK